MTLTIPGRTRPGTYVITATGRDANGRSYQLVSDTVTVVGAMAQVVGELAAAHGDGDRPSSPLAALALALVLVGSQFVLWARRRRRAG